MDMFIYIARFIYRIRYKLIMGVLIASVLAIYLTNFLPKRYVVTTTIFTGITSKSSLNDPSSEGADWNSANNAHDNIINLIQSKSTLEAISLGLIAQHLIYGDPNKDNNYISAEHYKQLLKITPPEVLALVDKGSFERTVENFKNYRTESRNNFIYALFNWDHQHYSYLALKNIKVKRKESSDMIEISFTTNDPGIAMNTIALLNKELSARYEELLLSTSNDVVKYFKEQLDQAAAKLKMSEDSLVEFNTRNGIINYSEQTKHLAALNNSFEQRYEEILLANRSSKMLIEQLERQMDTRSKLMKENELFLATLDEISSLNGKIAEIEIFKSDTATNSGLAEYKAKLAAAERKIKDITNKIDGYKYSKEGVAIDDMVTQWLAEVIKYEKSKAELEVMLKRREQIADQFKFYSPVGPNLGRMDRDVRVAEESYLTLLHHLGLAHLKQKNILLNSGTLQVVTPPEFPLLALPRNREIYVPAVVIAVFLFICGWYLLIEFVDRTLRDRRRAERLSSGRVIGAFPRNERLKYRGYNKEVRRMAISFLANMINRYFRSGRSTIVSLLSIEHGEGKTFIAEQLREHWENMGFKVKFVSYHEDFNTESKQFLYASGVLDLVTFAPQEPKPDVIIVEYAPLKECSIPAALLNEADINLLVTDAQRAWRESDQPLFNRLRELITGDSLYIYLNNADREAVEDYTGQLPPYTKLRRLSYRLFNLGITSRNEG